MLFAFATRVRAGAWLLLLVMALAAVTRLSALDLIDYRYDEAVAAHFAFEIADGRFLTLAPMSGSIATHPPAALYLMAVPAWLARDVIWVAGFRAAADVAAAVLLSWLTGRSLGRAAGVVAGLAYALGPWVVFFARKTWVAPVGLFAVLALVGAFVLVGERRARGWPIAALGVALSIGSHLSGLYLLPALAFALWLGRRSLRPAVFAAGLAPLVVVAILYAAADAPGGFRNIQALMRAQGGAGSVTAAFDFALYQTSAAKLAEIVGLKSAFSPEGSVLDAVNLVPQVLMLFGIGLAIFVFRRKRSDGVARAALAAAGFWVSVVMLQLRPAAQPQPHYVQLALPAACALIGYAAATLWRWSAQKRALWPRLGLAGVLIGVAGYDLAYTSSLNAAAAGPGPFPGYRPLAVAQRVTHAARAHAAACSSGEILIGAAGADPEVDEQAAVYSTLLADLRPRLFDTREAVVAPRGCAIWALAPGGGPALAAFGIAGDGALRAGAWPGAGASRGQWANGIEALGAGVGVSGRVWATVTHRVMEGADGGGDVHWYARLDSGSRQVASRDIAGVRSSDWRGGDLIGLYFDFGQLQLDRGAPLTLRIGSYRYPEVSGIGVKLPNGAWEEAVPFEFIAP